jgi:hypothetical protein
MGAFSATVVSIERYYIIMKKYNCFLQGKLCMEESIGLLDLNKVR